MKFNTIKRGHNRQENTDEKLYEVLDAGFLCHISFISKGTSHIIPTTYGRKGDTLYIHGSTNNHMLQELLNDQVACISVTHLDGIVLAQTLFNTSANYRTAIVYGKAEKITDPKEHIEGLKIITENIIKGRWDEVRTGTDAQLKATMVLKIPIESASVKIRAGGPQGDEADFEDVWSGHLPLTLKAEMPVEDLKFGKTHPKTKSVEDFYNRHQ